jgi:hypothetical protein
MSTITGKNREQRRRPDSTGRAVPARTSPLTPSLALTPNLTTGTVTATVTALVTVLTLTMTLDLLLPDTALARDGGWSVSADVALLLENTYPGSDEHYLTGLPALEASRESGAYTWFVSLPWRGVGVSRVDPATGATASLSANFGGERGPEEYSVVGFPVEHSERTRSFLAGSPTVTTPVFVEAAVEYPTRFGILAATLGYHPTSIENHAATGADRTRHGLLARLQYMRPLHMAGRLAVFAIAGIEVMDAAYADAWFSVDRPTTSLAAFDAGAGLRDVQAALHANYRASERIDVALYCSGLLLLGDAAASPYTRDRGQQTVLLRTTYAF